MTDAEKRLWGRLRNRQVDGIKFRRQVPLGPYIVDFASLGARMVIELDGGQHAMEDHLALDRIRDQWLREQGFRVLRFWNHDVLANMEGVLTSIQTAIHERNIWRVSPPPRP